MFFFINCVLNLGGQSGPVESKSRWPECQIRWPRANGPVLTTPWLPFWMVVPHPLFPTQCCVKYYHPFPQLLCDDTPLLMLDLPCSTMSVCEWRKDYLTFIQLQNTWTSVFKPSGFFVSYYSCINKFLNKASFNFIIIQVVVTFETTTKILQAMVVRTLLSAREASGGSEWGTGQREVTRNDKCDSSYMTMQNLKLSRLPNWEKLEIYFSGYRPRSEGYFFTSVSLILFNWGGGGGGVTPNASWDRSHGQGGKVLWPGLGGRGVDNTSLPPPTTPPSPPPRQHPPTPGQHLPPLDNTSLPTGQHSPLYNTSLPPPGQQPPPRELSAGGRYASYWNAF